MQKSVIGLQTMTVNMHLTSLPEVVSAATTAQTPTVESLV